MAYSKYFKRFKGRGLYDVFGPTHKNTASFLWAAGSGICAGKSYVVKIPKSERFRYWQKAWEGQTVVVKGFLRLSYRGNRIVCVENNKKFLTLPSSWLSTIKKYGCNCSTSTIWAKGCQCGGA